MKESTQSAITMAGILVLATVGLADSSLAERITERHTVARCLYSESGSQMDDDGSVTTWLPGGRVVSVRWDSTTSAHVVVWNDPCTDEATEVSLTAGCVEVFRDTSNVLRARMANGTTVTIDAEDDCPERSN